MGDFLASSRKQEHIKKKLNRKRSSFRKKSKMLMIPFKDIVYTGDAKKYIKTLRIMDGSLVDSILVSYEIAKFY